jgi:hypothetical protein
MGIETQDRIEQIRRSHASARPKHDNPAWLHTHNDLTVVLESRDALHDALFNLVRYHEDGDYAEHMDARAKAATDGNVSALEALLATANAALKTMEGS